MLFLQATCTLPFLGGGVGEVLSCTMVEVFGGCSVSDISTESLSLGPRGGGRSSFGVAEVLEGRSVADGSDEAGDGRLLGSKCED